jgi:hypothetical protein
MTGATGLLAGLDRSQRVVALQLALHMLEYGEGAFPAGEASRREELGLPAGADLGHLLAAPVQLAGVWIALAVARGVAA